MIKFKSTGDFTSTKKYLKKISSNKIFSKLEKYAEQGVEALKQNTPKNTGLTAMSWGYDIEIKDGKASVSWTNSNINNGVKIALIIQYGHATGNGAWIEGVDYINPALRPILDKMVDAVWKEVTS